MNTKKASHIIDRLTARLDHMVPDSPRKTVSRKEIDHFLGAIKAEEIRIAQSNNQNR